MKTSTFIDHLALLLAATVLLPFLQPLHAEIIGVEPFSYPDGPIANRSSGAFWNYKNDSPAGYTSNPSAWLAVSGTPAVTNGTLTTADTQARRAYNGASETQGAVNDANVAKAVYYRVTVTTGATVPGYMVVSSYDSGTERVYFGKPFNSANFGLGTGDGADTNTGPAVLPNSTYTLVAKLDYAANVVSLYVNPDLSQAESTQTPVATRNNYTNLDNSTSVRLGSGVGGSPAVWDDLVVATTWEDLRTLVTTVADEDNGPLNPAAGTGVSLREAVKYSPGGSFITFAPALSGKTCTLSLGEMSVNKPLTIDGSALANGLTIDANGASRIFFIGSTGSLTLRALTLTGANTAADGGAIYNFGVLNIHRCTFFGNRTGGSGGAVLNFGQTTATHSTFSGNTAAAAGAAFYNGGNTLTLRHCTVVGNTATGSSAGGLLSAGPLTLENTIIADNRGSFHPDIAFNGGTITRVGANLIGRNDSVATTFPAGSPNAQGDYVGTAAAPLDPKLSPLGSFGGPTMTMHPLIGSPVIDTVGTTNPGGADQRGFARFVDGNASFSSQLDIGAVEAGPLLSVTTAVDENNGPTGGAGVSLREILGTNPSAGARIGFSTSQFPATITLTQGELSIPGTVNGLFIDASNLTGPVTISGNNLSRVFNIPADATVAMQGLAIVNGRTPSNANGGGILNAGTLTLNQITLSGNAANPNGGGIYNLSGTVTLNRSTLSGNSANNRGGGIYSINGTAVLNQSTLSGNSAIFGGGVFISSGTAVVNQSTVSGNSGNGGGGGVNAGNSGAVTLKNSIVAANGASNLTGSITLSGANLITDDDPLLAPLGDYGGTTRTLALKPGSPARNAAGPAGEVQQINIGAGPTPFTLTYQGATTPPLDFNSTAAQVENALGDLSTIGAGNVAVSLFIDSDNNNHLFTVTFQGALLAVDVPPFTGAGQTTPTVTTLQNGHPASAFATDQRGFPIVGVPDLGAYEAGTLTNFNAFIYETLPADATIAQYAATFDFDGDGATNQGEFVAGTVVTDRASVFRVTAFTVSSTSASITFPTVVGRTYTIEESTDLRTWTFASVFGIDGTGYPFTITSIGNFNNLPRYFQRVRVSR